MNNHYQTIILGGGLSGLTVAHNIRQKAPNHKYLILEKSDRTGGVIKSHHEQGFITELGPHGFLDNCKESKILLEETGLDAECIKAPLIDFVRYVYLHGKLNLIPQTPKKIIKAPLIPWHAKLRILADLWKPPLKGEPTVAKWANYRFGPALLPYLDAVYTGTYAGDFNRLTIDSVMPGIRNLEKDYGSVIRGLLARMKTKKKDGAKFSMPAMTSFPEGMQRLPEQLSAPLKKGEELLLNTEVTAIQLADSGYRVISQERCFTANNVVFALPINNTLNLLGDLAPDIPEKSVPQAWISTVVLGFTDDVILPPGFGFLIPEQEKRFVLGALFSSNMFPKRAPEGHIVFETLVGGRRHPEKLELDDATLTQKAFEDVRAILNIKKKPVYSTVLRPTGAIPQLERNYPKLLKWREAFSARHKGLHICGFGWEGIGLNDMMKIGTRVAANLLASDRKQHDAEVKGIYF